MLNPHEWIFLSPAGRLPDSATENDIDEPPYVRVRGRMTELSARAPGGSRIGYQVSYFATLEWPGASLDVEMYARSPHTIGGYPPLPSAPGYDGSPIFEGDRIELHPATDLWMRGARFGRVHRLTGCAADVLMDNRPGIIECAYDLLRKVR